MLLQVSSVNKQNFYLNDHTTARTITINYAVNLDVKLIKYKMKENQNVKISN